MKNVFGRQFGLFIIIFNMLSFYLMPHISLSFLDNFIEDSLSSTDISSLALEASSNAYSELPSINSRAYVVYDRISKQVLFGNDELVQKKMASTTKIMTALVILDNCNLDDITTVSSRAAGTGGSRLGLSSNDKVSIKSLLYGLMLCSGNDAAVALAEHCSGTVEEFAILMNAKAIELGLSNTNYVTPHGLDADTHHTTAFELALLSDYALENQFFKELVSTKSASVTINSYSKNINNTNELLGVLDGIYGIKTGFTNGANRCLVTACKRGDMDIICVVLGADTKQDRTSDSIKLIEYAFSNYTYVDLNDLANEEFNNFTDNFLGSINISKSIPSKIEASFNQLSNPILAVRSDLIDSVTSTVSFSSSFEAPVSEGTYIGSIYLHCGSDLIESIPFYFSSNIERKTVSYYFTELLEKLLVKI